MKEVENKFIVINIKDLENLTEEGKEKLYTIIYAIEKARKMHNKKINNYWVCNQDEPYAEQVKNLILSDGKASQLEPLVSLPSRVCANCKHLAKYAHHQDGEKDCEHPQIGQIINSVTYQEAEHFGCNYFEARSD